LRKKKKKFKGNIKEIYMNVQRIDKQLRIDEIRKENRKKKSKEKDYIKVGNYGLNLIERAISIKETK
jgi:hypothetical protein